MNPGLQALLFGRLSDTEVILRQFRAGGTDGVWNSFGDLTSIYQEGTGVTAGAVASPNGLTLDKKHSMVRRSEIATVSSVAGVDIGGPAFTNYTIGPAAVVGNTYEILYTVSDYAGTGTVSIAGSTTDWEVAPPTTSANGTVRQILRAKTTALIRLFTRDTNTANFSAITIKEIPGNHSLQATAAARPTTTSVSGFVGAAFDGVDDSLVSATGGGGSAGFFWCGSVKVVGGAGSSRSVWSDVGTNTGYRVRLTSTNKLALGAGDGAGYTSATSAEDAAVGSTYVFTCWDDGVNLNAQINLGPVAQTARPVVSAGGAGFTYGKDNGAASAFANITIFEGVYKKNTNYVSESDRLRIQKYMASRAGLVLV